MDILTINITVALILTATSPGRAYTNTANVPRNSSINLNVQSEITQICVQQGAIKTIRWTHWSFLWLHINFPIGSTRDYTGPPFKFASLNLSIKWHKTKMSCAKEVYTMNIFFTLKTVVIISNWGLYTLKSIEFFKFDIWLE